VTFLTLLLIGSIAMPTSAVAETQSLATCVDQHPVTFSPGISLTSGTSSFRTEPGPITCVGAVDGDEITGPGTFSQHGVAQGDCSQGSLSGTVFITVPTSAGPTKLTIRYQGTYGPAVGVKSAPELVATFVYYPTKGDCITTPVTEIAATQETTLMT
jgi:hypothetical protein